MSLRVLPWLQITSRNWSSGEQPAPGRAGRGNCPCRVTARGLPRGAKGPAGTSPQPPALSPLHGYSQVTDEAGNPIGFACLILPESYVCPHREIPHLGHSKVQSSLSGLNCATDLKMLLAQSPSPPASPEWGPGSVPMPPMQECLLPVALRETSWMGGGLHPGPSSTIASRSRFHPAARSSLSVPKDLSMGYHGEAPKHPATALH